MGGDSGLNQEYLIRTVGAMGAMGGMGGMASWFWLAKK